MTLTTKLSPFIEINGLVHINTVFEVYDNINKTNLIHTQDAGDLLLLSVETDMPIGDEYYVVATRKFNRPNIDYDVEEFILRNDGEKVNQLILTKDVIIKTPVIAIEKKDIESAGEKFTLRTSPYKTGKNGSSDGITHTHWFIYSGNELIDAMMYQTDNLTSIDILKSKIKDYNKITFKAIHCSNSIESKAGEYTINFNSVNFNIVSLTENIPLRDYKLQLKKIDSDKNMKVVKIEFIDNYGSVTKVVDVVEPDGDTNEILFSKELFENYPKFKLIIYSYGEKNEYNGLEREFTLNDKYDENPFIPDYEYTKKLTQYDDIAPAYASGVIGDIVNDRLFLPKGDKIFEYTYNYTDNKLVEVKEILGITLYNNGENTYINYTTGGYLIVDTVDNGVPTFMIYKHNVLVDSYALIKSLPRPSETKTVTDSSGLVQISKYEFLYSPFGQNKIIKYNLETNTIVTIHTLEVDSSCNSIIKLKDGRILIVTDISYKTYIINLGNGRVEDGPSVPNEHVNDALRAILLVNGDYLLYNDIIDSKLVYFDRDTYKFELLEQGLRNTETHTVCSMNGPILFLSASAEEIGQNGGDHVVIELFE